MTRSPSPRPLSIKLIASYLVFHGCFLATLPDLLDPHLRIFKFPLPFIPYEIIGWPAAVLTLSYDVLYVVLGLCLWFLNNAARRLAVLFISYNLLIDAWHYFEYDALQLLQLVSTGHGLGKLASASDNIFVDLMRLALQTLDLLMLPLEILALYFLIQRRSAFVKPANRAQS